MKDENKQPGIKCDNIFLKSISYKRAESYSGGVNLKLDFSNTYSLSDDKNILIYDLEVKISEEKENPIFTLECTITGVFSIVKEEENMSLEEYCNINAPATLFPFLRETVANVTQRSGLKPFILPPMNIQAILRKEA